MAKSDPEKLAAALRENLRKRKERARSHVAQPSFGSDEEGDVVPPDDIDQPGAWVSPSSHENER
jgi:hypothetical protein